jgi:hypothetical protein
MILFATVLVAQACRQSSMPGLRDAEMLALEDHEGRARPPVRIERARSRSRIAETTRG